MNNQTIKTPITDESEMTIDGISVVLSKTARMLERKITALELEIARLKIKQGLTIGDTDKRRSWSSRDVSDANLTHIDGQPCDNTQQDDVKGERE